MQHAATAVAVRPHAVVRAQVSLLRFQFARRAGADSAAAIHRRAARRSGDRSAGAAHGRPLDVDLLRRRHAEPVRARRDRTLPGTACARASPSQPDIEITLEANPGHHRARPLSRLSRRGRQSRVARRADVQRAAPEARSGASTAATTSRARSTKLRSAGSTTSISTSCTACRQQTLQQALADVRRGDRAASRRTSRTIS